jgi:hypothetical protein
MTKLPRIAGLSIRFLEQGRRPTTPCVHLWNYDYMAQAYHTPELPDFFKILKELDGMYADAFQR